MLFTRILGIYLASYGSIFIPVSTNELYDLENVELYKKFFCQLFKFKVLF